MKLLSIVTINKNNARGLACTIQSLSRIESSHVEHLVVDGCSTDDSKSILHNYSKLRLAYSRSIFIGPDQGIYDAWNKGISVARGKYCLFLNSGDVLAPEFDLSSLLSCLSLSDDPLLLLPVGINNCGKISRKRQFEVNFASMFFTNVIHHQGALYKLYDLTAVGLYSSKFPFVGADYHLNLRFLFSRTSAQSVKIHYYSHELFSIMESGGISISNPYRTFWMQHLVRVDLYPSIFYYFLSLMCLSFMCFGTYVSRLLK